MVRMAFKGEFLDAAPAPIPIPFLRSHPASRSSVSCRMPPSARRIATHAMGVPGVPPHPGGDADRAAQSLCRDRRRTSEPKSANAAHRSARKCPQRPGLPTLRRRSAMQCRDRRRPCRCRERGDALATANWKTHAQGHRRPTTPIPSTAKPGEPGCFMGLPLRHRDEAWSFDHIETPSTAVPNAPFVNEIVVCVGMTYGTFRDSRRTSATLMTACFEVASPTAARSKQAFAATPRPRLLWVETGGAHSVP